MTTFATTRLSSKGQIVIPEEIRNKLALEPGVQFIVIAEDDVVILKIISPPSLTQFDSMLNKIRDEVQKAGLTESDVNDAIKKARIKQ